MNEFLPELLRRNATWLREGNDPEWYGDIPDHMEQAADALGQATRWIPVTESLPETGGQWDGKSWVVAWFAYGNRDGHGQCMTTMSLVNLANRPDPRDGPKPTHWIPLPVFAGNSGQ